MPHKYFLFILSLLLIISCNNSNKNSKVKIDSDKMPETAVTQTADDLYIVREEEKAVINSDCDYYLYHGDTSSGKLKKGQSVIISDYFYSEMHEDGNINIFVEVETLDKTFKGRVIETNLSYPNPLHDIRFKNIPLTRNYYYTESVEKIYKKEYLTLIYEDVSEEDTIKMMRWFFSPKMMLISERHLYIGGAEYDSTFRILSVDKKNENTYLLKLCNLVWKDGEFEIVLLVDNDGITITQIINKNGIYLGALSEHDLNIKYIPYNKEKSEKIKKDVLAWCFEQFEILGIKNDKL